MESYYETKGAATIQIEERDPSTSDLLGVSESEPSGVRMRA
jgi:hypothetical protein